MNTYMNSMKNKEFLDQDESNDIFNPDEDDSNEKYEVLQKNAESFKQPDPFIRNLSIPLPQYHQDYQPQQNQEDQQTPQMNLQRQTDQVNSSNKGNHQNSNYNQLPKQDLGQNYDYQPLFLTRNHQLIQYPHEMEIVNCIEAAKITQSSSSDEPAQQQLEEENLNPSAYFGEGVSRSQIVSGFTLQEQNQECLNNKKSLNSLGQDNGLIQEKDSNQIVNKSLSNQRESKEKQKKMIQQTPSLQHEMFHNRSVSYPDLCGLPLQLPNYEDTPNMPNMETRIPSNTIDHQNGNGNAVNQTTITADQSFSIQLKKQQYLSNQFTEQNQYAPKNDEKLTINSQQQTEAKVQTYQYSMTNQTTKLMQSSMQEQPIQSIQLPFLLPPQMINSYKSPPDRSTIDTLATKNIQCSNSGNQIQNFQLPITPESTPSDKAKIFSSDIYKKEEDQSTHFKSSGVSPSFSHIHSLKYQESPQKKNRSQSQMFSSNSTNSGKQFTPIIAATKAVQPYLSRSSAHYSILPTPNVTQINQTIKEDFQMQLLQLPNPFLTFNEKQNSSNSQHDLSIFQINNNNELNQQQQQFINSSQNPFFPSTDTQQQMQLKLQRNRSSQQPEGSIFLDSYKHHKPTTHNQNPKQISLSESPENSFFWKPQKKIGSSIFNSKQNLYSPQCSIIQQQSQKQEPFSQLSLQDLQPKSIQNLSLAFNQNNISQLKQNQHTTPPPLVSYPNSANQQFQPHLPSSSFTNYFENPIKFSNEQQKTMFSPSEENLSQFKQLFNNIQNLEQPIQPILNQFQHQQLLPEQNTFDQNQSNLYSNQSEYYFHSQHLFQQNQVQNSQEQIQRQNTQKQQHYQNFQQQQQKCQLQQQQQYQQQPYQQQQQQNEQFLQQLQQLQQQQQQEVKQPQQQILEQQIYQQQGFQNQSQGNYQIMQTQKLPDYMGCFPTNIQSKDPNQQRKMNEELQLFQYGLNTAQAQYSEQNNNQKSNDLINNYDLQNPYLQPQIMLYIEQRQNPNQKHITEQSLVIPNNYTEPIQYNNNNNELKPWGVFKQNLYPEGFHEQTRQATNQHQQAITLMPQQNPQLFRNVANNLQEYSMNNQIQNMPLSIAVPPSVFNSTHNGEYLIQNHNHLQIDQGTFNQKQLEILNDVKPQQNRSFKNASFDSDNKKVEDKEGSEEELGLVINDEQNNDQHVKMKNSTKKSHINFDTFENICENSTFAPKSKSKSKNETKNIPKNYAKAFLRYILDKNQKNEVERIISSIMRSSNDPSLNLTYEDIRQVSRTLKITMNAIKDVRKIWFDDTNTHSQTISKFMRIASYQFLQKEAISYIFSSNKIKNSKPHIIYRHVMQLAICDPSKFNNIKNIFKNAYNIY